MRNTGNVAAQVIARVMSENIYANLMFTNIATRIQAGTHPLVAMRQEIVALSTSFQSAAVKAGTSGAPPSAPAAAAPIIPLAPKRGRGRPRKPVAVAEAAAPVKRGRGRPRTAAAPVKRGRGRPRKPVAAVAPKRGRGRPRKPAVAATGRRGRGRPAKPTTGLPVVPAAAAPPITETVEVAAGAPEPEVLNLALGGESLPPVLGS